MDRFWPFDSSRRAAKKAEEQLAQLNSLQARRSELEALRRKGIPGAGKKHKDLLHASKELQELQNGLLENYQLFWELTKSSIPQAESTKGKEQWLLEWDMNDLRNSLYLPAFYTTNYIYVENPAKTKERLYRLAALLRPLPTPAPIPEPSPEKPRLAGPRSPSSPRRQAQARGPAASPTRSPRRQAMAQALAASASSPPHSPRASPPHRGAGRIQPIPPPPVIYDALPNRNGVPSAAMQMMQNMGQPKLEKGGRKMKKP